MMGYLNRQMEVVDETSCKRENRYPRSIIILQILTILVGVTVFFVTRPSYLLQGNDEQLKHFDKLQYEKHIINSRQAASVSYNAEQRTNEKTHISKKIFKSWAYPRLLTPEDCSTDQPYKIILAIKSLAQNTAERDAIRRTWGNETLIAKYPTKRVFLLGRPQTATESQQEIEDESNKYGDILQGDFEDSFQNLTLKDYLFLSWFSEKCDAKFIFKGDDDIFLNRFLLKELLDQYEGDDAADIVIGSVLRNSPRITNDTSKYYVSSNVYQHSVYPPYVSGGGFVISKSVATKILTIMPSIPPIPIDDAFLGLCLERLGISWRLHNNRAFKSWGIHKTDTPICDVLQIYTLHRMEADELIDVWEKIIDTPSLVDKCQFKQIPAELLKL